MLQITNDNFETVIKEANKPVLIDFFAEWCQPCKVMMPQLEEIDQENEEVLVCKADVDMNDRLCSVLRISSVPTVVVFNDGQEIARSVGLTSKKDILKMASV